MLPMDRPHLDTVVILKAFDGNDRFRGSGTGFLCRARHYHHRPRELLFLVTSAHVVGRNRQRIDVLFQPSEGDEPVIYSVTARSGAGPSTWFANRTSDLAALLLDPARLPENEIHGRSFDVEADTLSIRELRKCEIVEGTEGLLVGFVRPLQNDRRDYPAVRSVALAEIPKRGRSRTPLLVEGTAFPGDSGSPVIVKPERGVGRHPDTATDGKLLGIAHGIGTSESMKVSDDAAGRLQIEETATLIHLVPVDALRTLLHTAVGYTILAETFGPKVRRVRGWLRGRGRAD